MPSPAPLQDPRLRSGAAGDGVAAGQAERDRLLSLMTSAGLDEAEARAILEETAQLPEDDDIVAAAVPPDAEAALRRGDRAGALRIVQDVMALDPTQAADVVDAMAETPLAIKRSVLERATPVPAAALAEPPAPPVSRFARRWRWLLLAAALATALWFALLP